MHYRDRFEGMGGGLWSGFISSNIQIPLPYEAPLGVEDTSSELYWASSVICELQISIAPAPGWEDAANDGSFFAIKSVDVPLVPSLERLRFTLMSADGSEPAECQAALLEYSRYLTWK
jgi:hypothetical protein